MKSRFIIFILVVLSLYITGCGYTTGSLLPSRLRTVYVKDFENKIDISTEPSDKDGYRIYRAGVENDITQEIIDEFIFDGNLRIVSEDEADLILKGELLDYYKQPLRYDRFDTVEEYRVIVTVNIELLDTAEDKVMWKEENFTGFDSYRLTGSFAGTEEDARDSAINDLAKKIVEKTIEGW